MKKLLLLLFVCLALTARAEEASSAAARAEARRNLDLPITNDFRNSRFYFDGTGTATVEYNGQTLTACFDIDFEHPAEGRYGTLELRDAQRNVVARYALVNLKDTTGATTKRVTLKGIEGTKESILVNIDFARDGDRNYSIAFGPDGATYFKPMSRLNFDSELRIAPRVKSAEEIEQEAKVAERQAEQAAERQAKIDRRKARQNFYDGVGVAVVVLSLLFTVWMLPRAMRRERIWHLVLFTLMALVSCFPPFFILPLLPGYFWWYYHLYKEEIDNYELLATLRKITYVSIPVLGVVFYLAVGGIALLYIAVWLVAGLIGYVIYESLMEKSRCPHCNYYGPNEIVDRKFLDEEIVRTTTRTREYDHTEERDNEIIKWYRYRYNVKVEAHQRFKDFRRCGHCGEIFITFHYTVKTLSNKTY